jgi:hypothetical protein
MLFWRGRGPYWAGEGAVLAGEGAVLRGRGPYWREYSRPGVPAGPTLSLPISQEYRQEESHPRLP